jgi:hypothetical protein
VASIRTVTATRYVTPLREGGSLPAIVEADDDGLYVLKFRGAGQGQRALIAELISGEIARVLGLPVPELVFVVLDPALGPSEPDYEIQSLIKRSPGTNLALDFLPGSLAYTPLITPAPEPSLASAIVWFDAYVTNVDRSVRNPNILRWHKRFFLIDHGATLYFHHTWTDYLRRSRDPFPGISEHVLLPYATELEEADERLSPLLTPTVLRDIVALVPESWLGDVAEFATIEDHRAAYGAYLRLRLQGPRDFVEAARHAHAARV